MKAKMEVMRDPGASGEVNMGMDGSGTIFQEEVVERNKLRGMQRLLAWFCAMAMLVGCLGLTGTLGVVYSAESESETEEEAFDPLSIIYDTITYEVYLEEHDGAAHPDAEIEIDGADYAEASDDFYLEEDGLCTLEEGSVTYEVEVEEAGFYNLLISYCPIDGKNNTIEREIYINGEIPFENAQSVEFSRVWQDAEEIEQDSRGNDVRPTQEEVYEWQETYIEDSDGFYQGALDFYFEAGTNTITLSSTAEPMKIGSITLTQEAELLTYAEYQAQNEAAGYTAVSTETIKVQAEDAVYKSDSTLYPISDRTSPLTEPYHASKTRLNVIGGSNWEQVGQWITWEIEVPEDGLYEIAVRYRQNINTGVTVVRSVSIDGEIPFEEAQECTFYYKNNWQVVSLGSEDEAYAFYLTAGTHTLTMEVALGSEMSEIIRMTDECISELNRAYRLLLMVIGSSPDTYRDYQLEDKCPEALEILAEQYEVICEIKEKVSAYYNGASSSQTVAIDNLVNQLEKMINKPKDIPKQWAAFKDNIVSLGSWELSVREQPLELDYILIGSPGMELPAATATFSAKLTHEVKQFLASFTEDYSSIGEVYEDTETLEVWILADGTTVTSASGSGRDQATVIKNLVDNYFVAQTGISVNVKLVNSSVLLSATLAGEGPDVALNVAGVEPLNYALRNAVVDLTQFDDYEEVASWFHDDAMTQFTYDGGVYALPQTMSFHVMYYRADILKELGLTVPTTWDEFYECLAVIQKNNMNVGITPDYTTYAMYLYQYGGSYYTEEGDASALDSEEAIEAFKQWTGNYVNYGMPVSFDFANRFRTGEMPLAIADYTNYSYLSVFAPEIDGLWGFTIVPGYEDEDGNVDHSVSTWETASIIMATSTMQDEAWEFLKWWMSADIQSDYGNEMESVLGVAGRVATANLEALGNLPWKNSDYKQLLAQLEWVKAIPQVPGSYYLERNIRNAFYTVYNNNDDPRETLQDTVRTLNAEIDSKREEFGLPLRE